MTQVPVTVRRTPPSLLAERYGPPKWWARTVAQLKDCDECGVRHVGDFCPECELAAAQWRVELGWEGDAA